ncbi:MAG: DNA-3-methyladenine glycosylase [Phycisphaerales bacterium]
MTERLLRNDYAISAQRLAPRLIGQRLVRLAPGGERLAGVIVETEAYTGPADLASHAARGRRTARNESMYGPPGTFYVYFTYGMHHCCNVACLRDEAPEAVLIRAIEPTEGLDTMRRNRAARPRTTALRDRDLCAGPGRLCEALAIDLGADGLDLTANELIWIERLRRRAHPASRLVRSARVGLGKVGPWRDAPLRWSLAGSPFVSAPRPKA